MEYRMFAAIGGMAIGVIASGVIYWLAMRRVSLDSDKRNVRRWAGAFALAICTFIGGIPLIDPKNLWILALPYLGICLTIDSLHRIAVISHQPRS
jgi:hypothetical protein